ESFGELDRGQVLRLFGHGARIAGGGRHRGFVSAAGPVGSTGSAASPEECALSELWASRSLRPCSTSSSSLAAFFSLTRESRSGSCSVFSAGIPACSWRPRSISASNSAPNNRARLVIHNHSRKITAPARETASL